MTQRPSPRVGGMVLLVAVFGCDRCDARREQEAGMDALREANGVPTDSGSDPTDT